MIFNNMYAATVRSYLSKLTSRVMCAECDCFITTKRLLLCSFVCFLCFIPNTGPETLVTCDNERFVSSWSFQPLGSIHTSRRCDGLFKLVKSSSLPRPSLPPTFFLFVCFCKPLMQGKTWIHILMSSYKLI